MADEFLGHFGINAGDSIEKDNGCIAQQMTTNHFNNNAKGHEGYKEFARILKNHKSLWMFNIHGTDP